MAIENCGRARRIQAELSKLGIRVVRVLNSLSRTRGLSRTIVLDNGPEFTRRTLDQWAYQAGVELHFIQPGKLV
jgi:putative transposase